MNQNYRRKTEKVYVKVTSDFDATGYMQPRQITWGDGRTYPIEQVRDFRPASTIADLPGDCYTVIIKGQERHLFLNVRTERFPAVSGGGLWRSNKHTERTGRWMAKAHLSRNRPQEFLRFGGMR